LKFDVSVLEQRLEEVFPAPQGLGDLKKDTPRVAIALLNCPCSRLQIELAGQGSRRPLLVRELLDPLPPALSDVADNISRGVDAGSGDARVLVAASRLVWEQDPVDYVVECRDKQIRSQIGLTPGVRGPGFSEAVERAHGAAWFDTL